MGTKGGERRGYQISLPGLSSRSGSPRFRSTQVQEVAAPSAAHILQEVMYGTEGYRQSGGPNVNGQ